MEKEISEGKTIIKIFEEEKISKELPVFYNPLMKINRDLSVLLLNSIENMDMQIGDPMAGTGVRAARFLTELKKGKIRLIKINDLSENAVETIKENIEKNKEKIHIKEIEITQKDANLFILESSGFDYIDIDPFGTPNPFLNSAMQRISRNGILAVTATDTASLCGTYPKTCRRLYYAEPLRNEHMHELGLRILIRKVQLIASQYEKALIPICSYYKDHYFRIFFRCEKQKTKTDEIIKKHQYFHYCNKCLNYFVSKKNTEHCQECTKEMLTAGPLYTGQINDEELLKKMNDEANDKETKKFIELILNESKIKNVGFIDLHQYSRKYDAIIPRTDSVIQRLVQKGFLAEKTTFDKYAIKTTANIKEFIDAMK